MTSLRDYQKKFLHDICSATIEDELPGALQIYRNATQIIRMNALKQIFPCCEKLVGSNYFSQLTQEFVLQSVSSAVQINQQGNQFSHFLRQDAVLEHVPYLADMAALEWHWHEIFHQAAQRDMPASSTALLQIMLNAQFMHSAFPLAQIWAMCQDDYTGDHALKPCATSHIMLFQKADRMYLLPLSDVEYRVLRLLEEPLSLADLQNKYKSVYNETLTIDVVENLLQRQAIA